MKNLLKLYIQSILKEEIGRNYHTVDPMPNTWDSFEDFEIEYYPQDDKTCLLDVSFKGEKIVKMQKFGSQHDAEHHARLSIDNFRVKFMNSKNTSIN
jgi:hypothetical protein